MNLLRLLLWVFIIGLAVILLILAFRGVSWDELRDMVQQARIEYLLLAGGVLTCSHMLRALRWRILLNSQQKVAPFTVFWGVMVGYMGNSFLPARAGEVIRSVLLSRKTGISVGYVLATAFTERVIDVPVLVLFALLTLPVLNTIPESITEATRVMAIIGAFGIGFLFLAPRFEKSILRLIRNLPFPRGFEEKLAGFVEKFLLGISTLQRADRALGFGILTVAVWATDVVCAYFVGAAFNLRLQPAQILLLLACLGLSSAIPSTPGYVGIYQFVAVIILTPLGIARSQALVYILAFQAVSYIVVTVWGLLGLWKLKDNAPTGIVETAGMYPE